MTKMYRLLDGLWLDCSVCVVSLYVAYERADE